MLREGSEAPLSVAEAAAAVPRNMLLLAGGMAALYGMVELAAGAATLTFEAVGGPASLTGLAPAIFLASAALAALPAGRSMDRYGRARVIRAGFGVGLAGSLFAALGVHVESLALAVLGFVLTGAASGTVLLSRTAAADMHAPQRRPQAIALVLFGAVFGALLGPAIFTPLLDSGDAEEASLAAAWLGAAGFVLVGLLLASALRPDPQRIARALGHEGALADAPAEPLRSVVARPGVALALLAAAASWSAMVSLMTLTGAALVDHGHEHSSIFPVLAAHFVGMFALFAVVGRVVAAIGRTPSLAGGLMLLAASAVALAPAIESVALTALALFGVGLGWNLAYVAASAELSERASQSERGMLLGFSDLLSGLVGAALAVAGGIGLSTAGLGAVSLGAALLAALSAAWILYADGGAERVEA